MESKRNIYQRVLAIMSELDYVQKGSNKVNNQYTFVSHDAVSAAIHPLLVKHGIVVLPTVEEMTQEHNRTIAKLAIVFINAEDPSDRFALNYTGYGIDSGDKGPGKAISYAYKYALLKTFCLETGDDPDNDANARYEPEKCLEFDSKLPELSDKEKEKLDKFLASISKSANKHLEDVKREACGRMDDFIKALKAWKGDKDVNKGSKKT